MLLFDTLKALFINVGIFERHKKPLDAKVECFLLYLAGLSYNLVAQHLSSKFGYVSKFSAYDWVQKMKRVQDYLWCPIKCSRRCVAIDETKLKVNGSTFFVWSAIDVDTREILAVDATWTRNIATATWFLQDVMKSCTKKTVFITDKGAWYKSAFKKLGLKHKHVSGHDRSYIERFFRTLKERTKRFYNNFTKKKNNVLQHVTEFCKLWALIYYNQLRKHETLKTTPTKTTLT